MNDNTWIIDEDDRYSRMRLIAWWDQGKLAAARVLVVGAGALGNEVLKNLALLGVGEIYVVDMDEVEASNLTRSVLFRERDRGRPKAAVAAVGATELNPDVKVIPVVGNVLTDVGLGLVRDVDVVIGCLDNREARLWVNRMCWKVTTPWVDGGIQEINGVAKVYVPPQGACYECTMTDNDYRLMQLRYSCPLLRQEDVQAGKTPTAPTIASIIAGIQTQEALKLIHGLPVHQGAGIVFNGSVNRMYTTEFPRRDDCLSHETYWDPVELSLSIGSSVGELFAAAAGCFGSDRLSLHLDRDLIVCFECRACRRTQRVMQPMSRVSPPEALCPSCGEDRTSRRLHIIENVDGREEQVGWRTRSLAELGIPPYDIVKISCAEAERYFVIGKDRTAVLGGTATIGVGGGDG